MTTKFHNNVKRYLFITIAATAIFSCTRIQETVFTPEDGVSARMEAPQLAQLTDQGIITSKAMSGDFKFTFAQGDQLNVFPTPVDNSYMNFTLNPIADNPKEANFQQSAFTLRDGSYCAVYPAQPPISGASIRLNFNGQEQTEDNNTAHLSAYDYCWAQASINNNTGIFALEHRVSWLKLTIRTTDAASLTSLTVCADEGVPTITYINVTDGTVSLGERSSSDVLTLSLGGTAGIHADANSSITAYLTIPSAKYTNLTILAFDKDGNKYKFVNAKQSTLQTGKYYSITLTRTDIAEDTPFTRTTDFGCYTKSNEEKPEAFVTYQDYIDQISFGTTSDSRTCKFFNPDKATYNIFTINSKDLTVGEEYEVSFASDSKPQETYICQVVNINDGCVWLEDKTSKTGFILAIE